MLKRTVYPYNFNLKWLSGFSGVDRNVTPNRLKVTPNRLKVTPNRLKVTPNRLKVTPNRLKVEQNQGMLGDVPENQKQFLDGETLGLYQ